MPLAICEGNMKSVLRYHQHSFSAWVAPIGVNTLELLVKPDVFLVHIRIYSCSAAKNSKNISAVLTITVSQSGWNATVFQHVVVLSGQKHVFLQCTPCLSWTHHRCPQMEKSPLSLEPPQTATARLTPTVIASPVGHQTTTHKHTHTHTHTLFNAHTHIQPDTSMHRHTLQCTDTHFNAQTLRHTHTHMQPDTHATRHTHPQPDTQMHTHTHMQSKDTKRGDWGNWSCEEKKRTMSSVDDTPSFLPSIKPLLSGQPIKEPPQKGLWGVMWCYRKLKIKRSGAVENHGV